MMSRAYILAFTLLGAVGILQAAAPVPMVCSMPEVMDDAHGKLVAATAFADVIGATACEDLLTGSVTISYHKAVVVFTPDSVTADVNGHALQLTQAPARHEECLYVPLRPLVSALGGTLVEGVAQRTVIVHLPDHDTIKLPCRASGDTSPVNYSDPELYIMHADGANLRRLTYDTADQYQAELSADGQQALIRQRKNVLIRAVTARGGYELLDTAALNITDIYDASFVEDGTAVLLLYQPRGAPTCLGRVQVDGTDLRKLATVSSSQLCVAQNGKQVAVTLKDEQGRAVIRIMDTDGGHPHDVNVDGWPAVFSGDGSRLLFRYHDDTGQNQRFGVAVVAGVHTGIVSPQTDNAKALSEWWGCLSPDGNKLYLVGHKGAQMASWLTNSDRSVKSELTTPPFRYPCYNPDGTRIYGVTEDGSLCSMASDGSDFLCLTSGYSVRSFTFTPDGQYLLLAAVPR